MKKTVVILTLVCSLAAYGQEKGAEAFRRKMLARTGGTVEAAVPAAARRIALVDARAKKGGELAAFRDAIASAFRLPAEVGEGFPEAMRIVLTDDGGFSVDPIARVAIVPAGKDAAETASRLWKALFCLFASDVGIGSQEGLFLAKSAAAARGMPEVRRATYRRAVEEGWAPAPTNDYQKAIWDAAHTNAPAAAF